ncbi:acyl-CoA thioesterase [Pararoseomonas indoligenes]|uniref:Acyl-CoA thioesterase n=1 Tax=Roseomonas indoligenes TaxID=2820811 RepID=A0A940S7M0_9PROT|nr:thioesterase family protein [Pararoseomonas indoligenes]MBP0493212.1 acyl-CoA thioesterase [Pararoseomonas indoligenes]
MSAISPDKRRPKRADFRHFLEIPTRWGDNDAYAHVNNVTYYSFFDTVVSRFLLASGAIDLKTSPLIGVVVETGCRYVAPISFPDLVTAGLRVTRIGNTSVRYEIGIFRNEEDEASAEGHFVHVYVDRATQTRPTPLPQDLRDAVAPLLVELR